MHLSSSVFSGKGKRTQPFGPTVWCAPFLHFSASSSLIHPMAAGRSPTYPDRPGLQNTFANNQSSGAISRRRPSKKEVPLYFHPVRRFSGTKPFHGRPVSRALHTRVHTDQTDIEQVFFLQPPHWKERSDGMTRLLRCQHKLLPTVCRLCVCSRRVSKRALCN